MLNKSVFDNWRQASTLKEPIEEINDKKPRQSNKDWYISSDFIRSFVNIPVTEEKETHNCVDPKKPCPKACLLQYWGFVMNKAVMASARHRDYTENVARQPTFYSAGAFSVTVPGHHRAGTIFLVGNFAIRIRVIKCYILFHPTILYLWKYTYTSYTSKNNYKCVCKNKKQMCSNWIGNWLNNIFIQWNTRQPLKYCIIFNDMRRYSLHTKWKN